MTQTHSDILRDYFDEVVNHQRIDLLPKYFSENYAGHGTPYVGLGVGIDDSGGEKVTIHSVNPGSPAHGKLQVGDEIVRASDGEHTWQTFNELSQSTWGQGAIGTQITVRVRREGSEHDITLERGLVQNFKFTYAVFENYTRETYKKWPDLHARVVNMIESGDMVAYHIENQGHNVQYGRSAVWAEIGFVRFQGDQISDWWSVEDEFAQLKQLGYAIKEPELVKG